MKIDFDPKKHIANLVTDEDGEVRELTAEDFKQFRPAAEVLLELFGAGLAADMLRPKKGGRPRTDTPKVFTGPGLMLMFWKRSALLVKAGKCA